MHSSARPAHTYLRVASLVLAASALLGGCAVDPEEASSDPQNLFSYQIPGPTTTTVRQYVGPLSACPEGMEREGLICYAPCPGGSWPEAAQCLSCNAGDDAVGGVCAPIRICRNGWWREACHPLDLLYPPHRAPRAQSALVCPAGQENINGSCYLACASNCTSQGILGCVCPAGDV